MIQAIVDFALRKKFMVLGLGVLLLGWGVISFHTLPVEAYPDVANNWVQVITQWPGRAAEEVEQQVTVPIEVQMNGINHLSNLRSISVFGLSVVTLVFDDSSENLANRQQVLERLTQASLPQGLNPQLGPDYSPVGQIYFYTLTSTNPTYDLMELKALQDWYLEKQLKSVPNVADVSSFGGLTREYQVQVDPNKLIEYGLSIGQVEQALTANNVNAGGSFIEKGQQAINIRTVGLMTNTDDIGATLLKAQNGTPVRIRDVATIAQGSKIRLGQIGKTIHREQGKVIDRDDAVEGIVLLRKGADPDPTLAALHQKVDELNTKLLPPGVKIVPHLDRTDLVGLTTHTVMHNLTEGIILVVVVLFLFLGNVRGALIVALTIPFSLLFASILLNFEHVPANLLSLGALDFGMVVHGSVVMVENILRHLGKPNPQGRSIDDRIRDAAHEVQRPVFYSIAIIITSYVPIFTLQRVEGRLFRPMAWTVAFALLGALVFSMLLTPVLTSFAYRKGAKEWHNPLLSWLTDHYQRALRWSVLHRWATIGIWMVLLLGSFSLAWSGAIGSEFLPHLDEGAIWARGTLPPSTGPSEGERVVKEARLAFASFPEVTQVVTQVGRPDDGTDTTGFFNTEYFVDLKPHDQWRPQFKTKDELIAAMDEQVEKIPGAMWNFSQPIADNMEEAVSGVKGELAIKLFGDDLKRLEALGDQIIGVMKHVQGVRDLGIFRVIGQPNLNLVVDRAKADRYGINVADVQDAVETAVGGKAVSQILDGERRYDLVVRYQEPYRRTIEDIENIRVLTPGGERVALSQLCDVRIEDGASMIYREDNSRYIAIKYSIRGRDLGSTVEEAMRAVKAHVTLPTGYHVDWAGQYESQQRSQRRLALIVPITVLFILLILYSAFDSLKWATLIVINILIAPIGGLFALWLTGTHFSVSSGIGFLALFGVSVQTGVILLEYINQLRARGYPTVEAVCQGAHQRLRPIMMTMLVAMLGLVPAALSHGIGSDSQRPFAIVIVGGLLMALPISVFVLPTLYQWWARPEDEGASARVWITGALVILLAMPRVASAEAPPGTLTLADAERLLAERSLAVLSQKYQVDASRAARLIAGYKPNPTVQFGAEQFPFASPVANSVPRFWSSNTDAAAQPTYTVQFTKTIERGGKRELRVQQADANIEAAEYLVADTMRTQLFQLRQAFAGALVARENLRLAQAIVTQYDQVEQLTAVKVSAGDLPPVERARIRAGRLQFAQAVIDAGNAYEQATRDLLNLLNYAPGDVQAGPAAQASQVVGDFSDVPITQTLDQLRAMSLEHRPDVQLARRNLLAASRGVDLALAQRSRDVAVTGEYQRVGEDHSVGALMQIPLFAYNNQKAGITQAEALRASNDALVQQAERLATTEVEKAYQSYLAARQGLELYSTDNVNQVRHLQEVAEFTWRQGGTSLFEFLETQRNTQQTLIAYNQARATYQIALWQLEHAVGAPLF